jgi:hypothetical protein
MYKRWQTTNLEFKIFQNNAAFVRLTLQTL